ncbi:hypothetical protein NBRC116594_40310 [Shimia sp. NS0008-38b]
MVMPCRQGDTIPEFRGVCVVVRRTAGAVVVVTAGATAFVFGVATGAAAGAMTLGAAVVLAVVDGRAAVGVV